MPKPLEKPKVFNIWDTREMPIVATEVYDRLKLLKSALPGILKRPDNQIRFALFSPAHVDAFLGNEAEMLEPSDFDAVLTSYTQLSPEAISVIPALGFDLNLPNREVVRAYSPLSSNGKQPEHIITFERFGYQHRDEQKFGYLARVYPSQELSKRLSEKPRLYGLVREITDTSAEEIRSECKPGLRYEVSPELISNFFYSLFREPEILEKLNKAIPKETVLEIATDSLLNSKFSLPELVAVSLRRAIDRLKKPYAPFISIYTGYHYQKANGKNELWVLFDNAPCPSLLYFPRVPAA